LIALGILDDESKAPQQLGDSCIGPGEREEEKEKRTK
jgi:hypothetical protein